MSKIKSNTKRSAYFRAYRNKNRNFHYQPGWEDVQGQETKAVFLLTTFSPKNFKQQTFSKADELITFLSKEKTDNVGWIDITGNDRVEIRKLGNYFKLQGLLLDDILSPGERAKAEDMGTQFFTLLPELAYEEGSVSIESNQFSIILTDGFVLTFHTAPLPAYCEKIWEKIKKEDSPVRNHKADYLVYLLLDLIIDNYFKVLSLLSDQLDRLEEIVIDNPDKSLLYSLTVLRHKIMVVKRAISPVRELLNTLWRTDNVLIEAANKRYFKEIYEHTLMAVEYSDNYREMVVSLQELYMNQVNTKMNEVMKTLTIVTIVLAPFTLISGIYGMNFAKIPFFNFTYGFPIAILCMVLLSLFVVYFFWKKKWF